jgi:thiamine-monophosphate kinase
MREQAIWAIAARLMPPGATGDDAYHHGGVPPSGAAPTHLYSVDTFVEGTHFDLTQLPLEAVGWRCLAAALSDIAACGGTAMAWLLGLTLPPHPTPEAVQALYAGFEAMLKACPFPEAAAPPPPLWGGDTTRGPHWVLSITAIGQAAPGVSLKRAHAQPGDIVLAQGPAGLAHLGWKASASGQAAQYPESIHRFRYPLPQFQAGWTLATCCPRAALMDTSDGVADAALKIAEASHLVVVLHEDALAVHPELVRGCEQGLLASVEEALLYGGEDFLLFATVSESEWQTHHAALQAVGFEAIGHVKALRPGESPHAQLQGHDGTCTPLVWEHTFQHFTP